jgi:transcriptional regulator with XRE-family HTH domain
MATSNIIGPSAPATDPEIPMDSRDLARRELGSRLFSALREREWNQSDLARAAGVPRELISTYVTGKAFPSPKSLMKITRALGYSRVEELIPTVIGMQQRDEQAPVDIRTWPGNPAMAWIKVNQAVPLAIAGEIVTLLTSERRRTMEAGITGKAKR